MKFNQVHMCSCVVMLADCGKGRHDDNLYGSHD